jgi:hypothetical protein
MAHDVRFKKLPYLTREKKFQSFHFALVDILPSTAV